MNLGAGGSLKYTLPFEFLLKANPPTKILTYLGGPKIKFLKYNFGTSWDIPPPGPRFLARLTYESDAVWTVLIVLCYFLNQLV